MIITLPYTTLAGQEKAQPRLLSPCNFQQAGKSSSSVKESNERNPTLLELVL
jgi:hypothetical protein